MSRFGNEYLAESVGYADGHANGITAGMAAGKKMGYTNGWNDAVIDACSAIAERDQEIARLGGEVHKGNATIKFQREDIEKAVGIAAQYRAERDKYKSAFELLKAAVELDAARKGRI